MDQTNKVTPEVIERIKNLIARVESPTANPNEARIAEAQYRRLLAKYNLKREDLDDWNELGLSITRVKWSTKKKLAWEVQLAAVLGNEYECRVANADKKFLFYGDKTSTERCAFMFQQLQVRLKQAASDTFKARNAARKTFGNAIGPQKGEMNAIVWQNSFLMGAVSGIHQQFQMKHTSFAWRAGNQNALARVVNPEIQEQVNEALDDVPIMEDTSKATKNETAMWIGFSYGSRMQLMSGLTQGTDYRLLI